MSSEGKKLLICNCEKSMTFVTETIESAAGFEDVSFHTNLCRSEIGSFEKSLQSGRPLCVACTQESPLFAEIAEEAGQPTPAFVNIRETAGWSSDGKHASPKMAALLAASAVHGDGTRLKSIESDGLCLVMGKGQAAFDTAALLNRSLSVTLVLAGGADEVLLPQIQDFPVFAGRVVSATGSLGAFEVIVDRYASLLPSSRGEPQFAMPRDGAKSNCSVIFDITGEAPLFSRVEGRDGYFRADPGDPAAVLKAVLDASEYVGEFEKPIYVSYDPSICAHERSKITGCTKCLDNCPPGAIAANGDVVEIDSGICGGCGNCAAHCPTGAISYDFPDRSTLIRKIQTLASTFLEAKGKAPVLLFHDATHGGPLINAMARFGRGLPANVIPLEVHSTSGIGHDAIISALVAGFRSVTVLADPRKQEEYDALDEETVLTDALLGGLGLEQERVRIIFESDPDLFENVLHALKPAKEVARNAFAPVGGKREVARAAIAALVKGGKPRDELISLPVSAPYGAVNVDVEKCTLCMACVSACPSDALRDNPEMPQLRFVETACVQCGICASTCPEGAITLEARYNLSPAAMQPATLNEDEPAECIRCGTPFAAKGILDRVSAKLGGNHWMFETDERISLIRMCDSCRLETLSAGGADPFEIAQRPRVRTTDDYIDAGKKGLSVEDFLSED